MKLLVNTNVDIDDEDVIREVRSSCNIDEVFSDHEIIEYVKEQFNPEQVFEISALETWAKDNGYEKVDPE